MFDCHMNMVPALVPGIDEQGTPTCRVSEPAPRCSAVYLRILCWVTCALQSVATGGFDALSESNCCLWQGAGNLHETSGYTALHTQYEKTTPH